MKRKRILSVTMASFVGFSVPVGVKDALAYSETSVFGLKPGTLVSQLPGATHFMDNSGGSIFRIVPPQPNQVFKQYIAVVAPNIGLCRIDAQADYIDNDGLENLLKILSSKYGEPQTRTDYAINWDNIASSNRLMPADIQNISVVFMGRNWVGKNHSDAVSVEYTFSNFDKCIAEIKGAGL